jgi:hypothetical protein
MNIEYMGINIPCKNISGLSFSEKIDNDNIGVIDVTLGTSGLSNWFIQSAISETAETISIIFSSYKFCDFIIVSDSVDKSDTEIRLQLRHKISDILAQNVSFDITGFNNCNPTDSIKYILHTIGLDDYISKSSFAFFCLFCNGTDFGFDDILPKKMDICYYHLVDISYREVINEICCKLGVIIYVDYYDNKLKFFNYCNLIPRLFRQTYASYNKISLPYVKKRTESVGDEYYNSFKIGIYPDTYVMQQIRYKYKCSNTTYSNVWFDESDIDIESTGTNQWAVTLKYNKYDVTHSIVYEANSIWTATERQAVTVNVSADVQRLAEYSATTLYGTPENPAWSIWEDENVYNDTACCRHTNPDGAVAIGNEIIRRFYRKQKKLSLDLAKFMPFSNGEILTFENKNWILVEQKINDDMSAEMELEELIND